MSLLLPWCFTLIAAVLAVAELRAWFIERREGLTPSTTRALLVLGGLAGCVSLGLFATRSTVLRPTAVSEPAGAVAPALPAPQKSPDDSREARALDELKRQRAALDEQIRKLEANLLGPPHPIDSGNNAVSPRTPFSFAAVAPILSLMILVMMALLFIAGHSQSMVPAWMERWRGGREKRRSQRASLDRMAAALAKDDDSVALNAAETIDEGTLDTLDRLDFRFMRGCAYLQVRTATASSINSAERERLLIAATRDFEAVVDDAPRHAEARYAFALCKAIARHYDEALAGFEAARPKLVGHNVPLDHNESVCHLHLAEQRQLAGNMEGAEECFRRVSQLGPLAHMAVDARLRVTLAQLDKAIRGRDSDRIADGIRQLDSIAKIDPQRADIALAIADAVRAVAALYEKRDAEADAAATSFLSRILPAGLPDPDESAADEILEGAVPQDELLVPLAMCRSMMLLKAIVAARAASASGAFIADSDAVVIARPLLGGLHLVPRDSELLGALGGLYFWFRRRQRDRAVGWLESAVSLGTGSRLVRGILEQYRQEIDERRGLLEWFKSSSSRLLLDSTLARTVRVALVEELSRFQETEPLVLDLGGALVDESPREPTLALVRERAHYLQEALSEVKIRDTGNPDEFYVLRTEYVRLADQLGVALESLERLEGKLVHAFGRILAG